ncbi:hypothetical protein H4R18_004307 [Coemansia javaensis]|uniref:Uncharacterized protein n=1 Tax=Coemansia javaensis TaxID=2761396 RepID=A0A9W8LHA0_9FUNG|nr:hypothetical protein H4R18_004307 [Coemansia javaensis]
MKLSALAAGLAAVASSLVSAAPTSNQQCATTINNQILSYMTDGSKSLYDLSCYGANSYGYWAGIARFGTSEGDMLQVINKYKAGGSGRTEFDKYLPTLQKYAKSKSLSGKGLDGLCVAWVRAGANNRAAFRAAQDEVAQALYFGPASDMAKKLGLRFDISKTILQDGAIHNGRGVVKVSLADIVKATSAKFTKNTSGKSGSTLNINGRKVDEIEWIKKFLSVKDSMTKGSCPGCLYSYRDIISRGRYNYNEPIKFKLIGGITVTASC